MLVYFVLSPLLGVAALCAAFCAAFCFVAMGNIDGTADMTVSFVAWPFVKVWGGLKLVGSWLHPGRPYIHAILLFARKLCSIQHSLDPVLLFGLTCNSVLMHGILLLMTFYLTILCTSMLLPSVYH